MELTKRSEQRAFDGVQGSYEHTAANRHKMRFSVFRPASAKARAPALLFLAGLTCTDETFMIKAGAQRMAAKLGLVLVSPDTSPRDTGIAGATGEWDFGEGAGFYLDASQTPYAGIFSMEDYVVHQLPPILRERFDGRPWRADAGLASSKHLPLSVGYGADRSTGQLPMG
jgi:S-formylglutathione hydrolase